MTSENLGMPSAAAGRNRADAIGGLRFSEHVRVREYDPTNDPMAPNYRGPINVEPIALTYNKNSRGNPPVLPNAHPLRLFALNKFSSNNNKRKASREEKYGVNTTPHTAYSLSLRENPEYQAFLRQIMDERKEWYEDLKIHTYRKSLDHYIAYHFARIKEKHATWNSDRILKNIETHIKTNKIDERLFHEAISYADKELNKLLVKETKKTIWAYNANKAAEAGQHMQMNAMEGEGGAAAGEGGAAALRVETLRVERGQGGGKRKLLKRKTRRYRRSRKTRKSSRG